MYHFAKVNTISGGFWVVCRHCFTKIKLHYEC